MAKNVIERSMNGRLAVCNTGVGARFTIELIAQPSCTRMEALP